jgi:MFS family permease
MLATRAETAAQRAARALINRDFALLWSGQSVSLIGDQVFDTTLVLWVATSIARGASWAPLAVSGIFLATFVPTTIAGPFAGVFVDRWNKRRTMLVMDALRAGLVGLLLVLTRLVPVPFLPAGHLPTAWTLSAIYAIVASAAVGSVFANPASFAMIGALVPEPDRMAAAARLEVNNSMAIVIGPSLAALLFGLGPGLALGINALSFLVSFASVLGIRSPESAVAAECGPPQSFAREMVTGLQFYARSRVLVTLTVSCVIALVGGTAINTLNVFFVTQNLHTSARLYGVLGAAVGIGSILGALVMAGLVGRLGSIRAFWTSLLIIGLTILVYARLTSFAAAVVVFFLFGFPNSALNVAVGPLLLRTAPPEMLGRIMSVFTPILSSARLLSAILVGFLASNVLHGFHAQALGVRLAPVDTIFMVAGMLCIVAALYTAWNLRGAEATPPASQAPRAGTLQP